MARIGSVHSFTDVGCICGQGNTRETEIEKTSNGEIKIIVWAERINWHDGPKQFLSFNMAGAVSTSCLFFIIQAFFTVVQTFPEPSKSFTIDIVRAIKEAIMLGFFPGAHLH